MYSYEQVEESAMDYFGGDELAVSVWMSKYAMKDGDGSYLELTPDDMHRRLAKEFSRIDNNYPYIHHDDLSAYGKSRLSLSEDEVYNLLKDFKQIIPQGSVMSVLGNDVFASLSNCVVIPSPYDSYNGIMHTDEQLAQLFKRRAGVGFDISTLRPKISKVQNSAMTTTGAVSFMDRFSSTTREVAQNGRRGALMLTMDCRHPDIMDFIKVKQDRSKVTGANISVMWHDDFMRAVKNDEEFTLRFPVDSKNPSVTKVVKARDVWDAAIFNAWDNAEPGMLYIDRIRDYSTCNNYEKIVSTNPCSEIGMAPDSCRLIAVNMFGSVKNPYTPTATFDFDNWYKMIYEAQIMMDGVVDLELESIERILNKIDNDPEPEYIKETERKTWEDLYEAGQKYRRTGLGFTALGDTLAALNIPYDDSHSMVNQIMTTKIQAEFDASIDMAITRGAFPGFDEKFETNDFTDMLGDRAPILHNRMMKWGRRNISISTVAPTGSLSILAKLIDRHGTTGGVEPAFSLWFTRRKKINPNEPNSRTDYIDPSGDYWQEFKVYHSGYLEWAQVNGHMFNQEENNYTGDLAILVAQSPYFKCTAPEIDWEKRVSLQGLIQTYITHAISSTINLPKSATIEDVSRIYMKSWEAGTKGTTVYRDGCRTGVLIAETESKILNNDAPKRPESLNCEIHNLVVRREKWCILIGFLGKAPFEVFAFHNQSGIKEGSGKLIKKGKGVFDLHVNDELLVGDVAGNYSTNEEEALTRLISLAFRHGVDIKFIVNQLSKSKGSVANFSKAINRVLRKYLEEGATLSCPECGSKELKLQEGCFVCGCGYSGCH